MIAGKKVSLRAVEAKDLEQLKDWRNIEKFRKNFREHKELSLPNQQNWFERITSSKSDYMFSIVDNDNGELIGACGLLSINWIIRSAEYSLYIGRHEKYIDSEGYADESNKLLINYGFEQLNLNKIWMEIYEFDCAKKDFIFRSQGFEKDGILRQNCFKDGEYHDSLILSLLKKDYVKL